MSLRKVHFVAKVSVNLLTEIKKWLSPSHFIQHSRQIPLSSTTDVRVFSMKFNQYAFCLMATFSSYEVLSAPSASLQVAKPNSTLFTDIDSTDDQVVAVGKFGTIVTSTDGQNWRQAEVPVQSLLTAVTIKSDKAAWACGHDATIVHSSDNGKTWQLQQYLPEQGKPCLDIEFIDENTGFAIGAYGMFYKTTNGGKTWQSQFISDFVHPDDKEYLEELKQDDPEAYQDEIKFILPHFNRLLIKDRAFYLVGEMGLVAKSEDKGLTWKKFDEFYPGSFFSVNETAEGQILVAGLRGNAFIKSQSDIDFTEIDIAQTATINTILPLEDSTLLFANSGLIHNFDGQKVSSEQLPSGQAILSATIFKNKVILATEKGLITWGDSK
ncbi:BNR repeat protein [Pseudoalteromonas phenolica]|uniref:BNR repeat protein n=3 Tax=Pseudoalteromonas phenolica TaxID=161398 RepID=A0A0S2K1S7_9GAMM|nr:BNR repeat protein [Pseudoalteromonas phenolica]